MYAIHVKTNYFNFKQSVEYEFGRHFPHFVCDNKPYFGPVNWWGKCFGEYGPLWQLFVYTPLYTYSC